MARHYCANFGWDLSGESGVLMGLIASDQGCYVEKFEVSIQPQSVASNAYIYWGRGGTAGTNSGTLPSAPLGDGSAATSKVLEQPGSIAADPYLSGAANPTIANWYVSNSSYFASTFPGDGVWVPPDAGLYFNVNGSDGGVYLNVYWREEE